MTKTPIALSEEEVSVLDIKDPFFDSLREEYDFDKWFSNIVKQKRKCWVFFNGDKTIGALLIPKLEEEPIPLANGILPKIKRLKLCLFKVGGTGKKIGELFIKISTKFALQNNVEEMYLTHFIKSNDMLVDLISEYGFKEIGKKKENNEPVFVKRLDIPTGELIDLPPLDISKNYWPKFYDGPNVKKFFVPIRPEFHSRLFIDYPGRQPQLSEYFGELIVEGNTIKKAYLCRAPTRKIQSGDLVVFYRSSDLHAITSIGVVETIYDDLTDPIQIDKIVRKRTVYRKEEIVAMASKPVKVILFTWHYDFDIPITLEKIRENGIFTRVPQSISELHHDSYLKLKQIGVIDGRYPVD